MIVADRKPINEILDMVRDADRIIVISDGRIVETGRHAELMDMDGEYSRLYSLLVEGDHTDDSPENRT